MFKLNDIKLELQRIIPECSTDVLLSTCWRALDLLSTKGSYDALVGVWTVCADGQCITLPRQIETPHAVSICGKPTLGHDKLFRFHPNGPGGNTPCGLQWEDRGETPVFKQPSTPVRIMAYCENPADDGQTLIVYGYDDKGAEIRRLEGGKRYRGWRVNIVDGLPTPDENMPLFSAITKVDKPETAGRIILATEDFSCNTGYLIGVYEWDDTTPVFRQIALGQCAKEVQIAGKIRMEKIHSLEDTIPIRSINAFLAAVQAVVKFDQDDMGPSMGYEARALQWLNEKEGSLRAPVAAPIAMENAGGGLLSAFETIN